MMRLTIEKRYLISTLYANKESKTKMANHIGVNYSTVFREIRRNTGSLGYDHEQAHEKSKIRKKAKMLLEKARSAIK